MCILHEYLYNPFLMKGIDLIEKWNEEDELEQELYLSGYGEEPPKKNKQEE